MLPSHNLPLLLRHQQRRTNTVPDLSPIEWVTAPDSGGLRLQLMDLGRGKVLGFGEFLEEDGPNFVTAGLVEDGEAECDVNARLESLVKGTDAIGGEEEDAVKILQGSEEDWEPLLGFRSEDSNRKMRYLLETRALRSRNS